MQPKFFVAENVGGLRSPNKSKDYLRILEELKNCGYIAAPRCYIFEEYGVPQKRHGIITGGTTPKSNLEYWDKKPNRNVKRFKEVFLELKKTRLESFCYMGV